MSEQPTPIAGTHFIGWAVFNWGISLNVVFRTRTEAQRSCCNKDQSWADVKDHFKVVKVKCIVL